MTTLPKRKFSLLWFIQGSLSIEDVDILSWVLIACSAQKHWYPTSPALCVKSRSQTKMQKDSFPWLKILMLEKLQCKLVALMLDEKQLLLKNL